MTTTKMRRGKRSLAAILAAMLMASVLAVVAGSPAQAANTSSEALQDTNSDGVGDAREFGGRDRYDTANRLAANFGKAEGLGNVPVAFVASGLKLVDAISVAGLAGFLDAPVLLTPEDSLNGGVADFIEDYGVSTIYVLGGPAAVSDAVVTAIEDLANEPTVSRIFGDDRYATAAAVASNLGGGAAWCGSAEAAAILANGGDVSLAYAMAISPVANRLQLPLLLTAADELPSATEDFITDQDIEHVVIMGGESSVSDDVSAALTSAGVDTVTRIDGDTPAAASAELAKLTTNGCSADLGLVSNNTVALVAESGLPDGVAASPVLASSYRGGDLVPMLVVGDTLPASVSDYLASTPDLTGTGTDAVKLHLSIVAVGGTAAVSDEVMQGAIAAAGSADALTAQISSGGLSTDTTRNGDTNGDGKVDADDAPAPGDDVVILRFSDNIVNDVTNNPALTNLIRDNLEINGAPARLHATTAITRGVGTNEACDPDTATVTLASALKAGDVVSLAGGARFGANMDQRTVAATSVTVPAPPRDTTPPVVNVIAIVGADAAGTAVTVANVQFSPLGLGTGDAAAVAPGEVVVKSAAGVDKDVESVAANGGAIGLTSPATFAVGDRITILSGALVDTAGNKSRARTFSVLAGQANPGVLSVTMSDYVHTGQARAIVPSEVSGATTNTDPTADGFDGIVISAKKGGAADGAAGNGWTIAFDRASAWKPDPKAAVDIDVRVNAKDRLISVRFDSGNAKFADLKAALEANSAFDAMFMVSLPAAANGVCGATADNPLVIGVPTGGGTAFQRGISATTTGGKTAVAIEVRFNAYVSNIAADTTLGDDVFAEVRTRYNAVPTNADGSARTDFGETGLVAAITGLTDTRLEANLLNDANGAATAGTAVAPIPGPVNSARYELETNDASLLPMVRDLVTSEAGTPSTATTDVPQVATGYAADVAATEDANENENARTQRRIGQSSSVKAPDFKA